MVIGSDSEKAANLKSKICDNYFFIFFAIDILSLARKFNMRFLHY